MKRLFTQLELEENGKLQLKTGTSYNHQGHTHTSKGMLHIQRPSYEYQLCYQHLERAEEQGYQHHLHSYITTCKYPFLFIMAPRKNFSRVVKPKAAVNYRLLCHQAPLENLLHQLPDVRQVYAQAEALNIKPWIQGRQEKSNYSLTIQYSHSQQDDPFFLTVFELLKTLTKSLDTSFT